MPKIMGFRPPFFMKNTESYTLTHEGKPSVFRVYESQQENQIEVKVTIGVTYFDRELKAKVEEQVDRYELERLPFETSLSFGSYLSLVPLYQALDIHRNMAMLLHQKALSIELPLNEAELREFLGGLALSYHFEPKDNQTYQALTIENLNYKVFKHADDVIEISRQAPLEEILPLKDWKRFVAQIQSSGHANKCWPSFDSPEFEVFWQKSSPSRYDYQAVMPLKDKEPDHLEWWDAFLRGVPLIDLITFKK